MIQIDIVPPPSNEARLAVRQEPQGPEVMFQTWSNLLFLHWEADPVEIQKTLPPGLFVDTHGGKAYVGVIPFLISDLRAAMLPPVPGTTEFLELNVRTYVFDKQGRPGVWFYSLDCNHALAVWAARTFFCLNYQSAEMSSELRSGLTQYCCHRRNSPPDLKSEFQWKALEQRIIDPVGSLTFFLLERYLLYAWAERTRTLYCGRVWHVPYEPVHVHVSKYDDCMLKLNGFTTQLREPAHRMVVPHSVRVKIFPLEKVSEESAPLTIQIG